VSPEDILRLTQNGDLHKELSRFFNSKGYSALERQVSENNAKFRDLPNNLKLASLYINRSGLDLYLGDLHTLLYKFRPPTIEEYLTPEVGGVTMESIYDGWREVLLRDFGNGHRRCLPGELVFTGAIGLGKSTIAILMQVWNLMRVCALRNPQATMGAAQNTLMVLALFTVTLDKASLALIKPFKAELEFNPRFAAVNKVNEFYDFAETETIPYKEYGNRIEFPGNIIVNIGSSVEHAISYSMFGGFLDEAEFRGGPERAFSVYSNLKERVRSRFLGSPYTLLTLVSSSRYSHGIIADYLNNIKPDDEFTRIYSFAIWEIKNFKQYENSGHFYVLRGTATQPHRILADHEVDAFTRGTFNIPNKCKVICVPEVYRGDFTNRISEALQNLAGEAVLHSSKYAFDRGPTEYAELTPELKLTVELGVKTPVMDMLPPGVFNQVFDVHRFTVAPDASRYVHFDLAETAVAGVAVVHAEDDEGRTVYVVDLAMEVIADTRIDLTSIENFGIALSSRCHLRKLTTDQFQSTQMRQRLAMDGAADSIVILSVDRTTEPYETVARLVQEGRVLAGKCPVLRQQWENIQLDNSKSEKKVFTGGVTRKDLSDAVVGAVYNAVMDVEKSVKYKVSDWRDKPKQSTEKYTVGFEEL